MATINSVSKENIARSFSMAANSYDQYAHLQQEIAVRLFERLQILQIKPTNILDLGCATGQHTNTLANKFPSSHITGIDLAPGMVAFANNHDKNISPKHTIKFICADAEKLPIASNSVDFIFSNCTFQWINDLNNLFAELHRVLSPGGALLFSTFGPDTLIELKTSFASASNTTHVNNFVDMHNIGDILLNCQFATPVVDQEKITIHHQSIKALMQDLKKTGARNLNADRTKGLTTSKKIKQMQAYYKKFTTPDNLYPATFEIIYGYAIKSSKWLTVELS